VPWANLTANTRIAERIVIRDLVDAWEEQGKLRVTKDGIVWIGEDKVDHP